MIDCKSTALSKRQRKIFEDGIKDVKLADEVAEACLQDLETVQDAQPKGSMSCIAPQSVFDNYCQFNSRCPSSCCIVPGPNGYNVMDAKWLKKLKDKITEVKPSFVLSYFGRFADEII